MPYLLDTNACIRVLSGRSKRLIGRLQTTSPREVRLCAPVKAELLFGARKSTKVAANLTLLAQFFSAFESYPFDDLCAEHYGAIRAELTRAGIPIGPNDLMIASVARAYDATLVTHNVDEFIRVSGLRVDDWE